MPAIPPRPSRAAGRWASLGALLLAGLAGCGAVDDTKFPPACPMLSLLQDAADMTRFAGTAGVHDARSLVVAARITKVPARCATAAPGKVRATLNVVADVARGPAARSDAAQVPYFVAVTEGNRVLSEQDFALSARFRPNIDQVSVSGNDIELLLPVTKAKTAVAYHIYVGFRLTSDELAYNRRETSR